MTMDAPTDERPSIDADAVLRVARPWLLVLFAAMACAFVFLLLIVAGPHLAITLPLNPPLPVSLWFLWLVVAPFAVSCWLRDPTWTWAAGAIFFVAGQLPRWLVPAVDLPWWLAETTISSAGWIVPAIVAGTSARFGLAAAVSIERAVAEYREWRS